MVVSDTFPDTAVTVIGYVPAGVPVAGLSCGLEFPTTPPQAVRAVAIARSNATRNCGTYRRAGTLAAHNPSQIMPRTKAMAHQKIGRGHAATGNCGGDAAV